MQTEETVSTTALKLFFLGFFIMFAGVVVLILAAFLEGNIDVSGAAIIFVGPIPIILGAGSNATLAVFLAAILTVIGFVVFFWMRRKVRF